MLFLYGESASGWSSPVGLGQGKFTVFEDKLGQRRALNALGDELGLTDRKQANGRTALEITDAFQGIIDAVKVYHAALPGAEIARQQNPPRPNPTEE